MKRQRCEVRVKNRTFWIEPSNASTIGLEVAGHVLFEEELTALLRRQDIHIRGSWLPDGELQWLFDGENWKDDPCDNCGKPLLTSSGSGRTYSSERALGSFRLPDDLVYQYCEACGGNWFPDEAGERLCKLVEEERAKRMARDGRKPEP